MGGGGGGSHYYSPTVLSPPQTTATTSVSPTNLLLHTLTLPVIVLFPFHFTSRLLLLLLSFPPPHLALISSIIFPTFPFSQNDHCKCKHLNGGPSIWSSGPGGRVCLPVQMSSLAHEMTSYLYRNLLLDENAAQICCAVNADPDLGPSLYVRQEGPSGRLLKETKATFAK